jgi:hypothetical protein
MLANGVPWNADAHSFVSTGSSSRGAMRGSISVHGLPASRVSSAGTLSMNTAAACLPASSYATVVNATGRPAARNPSSSRAIADTTSSRSQTRGDAGSVKPRLTSITTSAGRRPKPARP